MERKLAGMANGTSAVALLRLANRSVVFAVVAPSVRPPTTEEQLGEIVGGARKGVERLGVTPRLHGSSPGSRYDLDKVNGIDVLRYQMEYDVAPDHPAYATSRTLVYVFVSRRGMAMVSFAAPPAGAADLRPIADAVVRTASMPEAGLEDFGESRAHLLGKVVGKLVVVVGAVIAMVVGVVRSRRSAKRPQRGR
jgi:hypothetical protein